MIAGEKENAATGGSAKGIPEIEGLRSNRIVMKKELPPKKSRLEGWRRFPVRVVPLRFRRGWPSCQECKAAQIETAIA
jgi:hypothetical protein